MKLATLAAFLISAVPALAQSDSSLAALKAAEMLEDASISLSEADGARAGKSSPGCIAEGEFEDFPGYSRVRHALVKGGLRNLEETLDICDTAAGSEFEDDASLCPRDEDCGKECRQKCDRSPSPVRADCQ